MGLSQSKKPDPAALALIPSPMAGEGGPGTPQRGITPQGGGNESVLTSLNDTAIMLSQDADWLDESEMREMEDEDAIMMRELSATNTGDLSLDQWLATREADSRMSIRITATNVINKFMGRKTVEYTIETENGVVKRRFKDFEALRFGLEVRFPGALVPPLPPATQFGSKTDAQFLLRRRRLLQMFLECIVRHPFLSADDLFVEFIASTARFDRKTAWRSRDGLVKAHKWSVAARRWAQALCESETPANPQATMEAASIELAQIAKHLSTIKNSAKRNVMATAAMGDSLTEMGATLQKSSTQESTMTLFGGTAEESAVKNTLRSSSQLASQCSETIRRYADEVDEALLTPIRFETSFIETYQEALRRTKFTISRHRQAVSAYRQAREHSEMVAMKGGGRSNLQLAVQAEVPGGADGQAPTAQLLTVPSPSEMEKSRKKLQRIRMTAVQAQMNARRDINGILAIELRRFRAEREMRTNRLMVNYLLVNKQQSSSMLTIWSGCPSLEEMPSRIESPANVQQRPNTSVNAALSTIESSSFLDASAIAPPQSSESESMLSQDGAPRQLGVRRASQLRAKYPFQGIHEDELDVTEGEVLEGEIDDQNPEWVRAKSLTTGKTGLVPKTYVEEVAGAGDDEESVEGEPEMNGEGADKKPVLSGGVPTNYIQKTQDMLNGKGTKRSISDRE